MLFIPGEERFFAVVDTLPYRIEVISVIIVMVGTSRDANLEYHFEVLVNFVLVQDVHQ